MNDTIAAEKVKYFSTAMAGWRIYEGAPEQGRRVL
jgi:hypothetical protein